MMKIVILSQYIYPLITARAFRATELAKYFAREGHDVTLYGVFDKFDYTQFTQETGVKVKSFGKGLLFINKSDATKKLSWVARAINKLSYIILRVEVSLFQLSWRVKRIIEHEGNIDMLITIAVPWPIHWGTTWAKKMMGDNFPKCWVSDCGDPFMGNSVGQKPPFFWQSLEDEWGKMTDYIAIPIEKARLAYSSTVQQKVRIIPQGLDFSQVKVALNSPKNKVPTFAYSGTIYPGYRDPSNFLKYLSTLEKPFKFIVYTRQTVFIERFKDLLGDKLEIRPYVERMKLIYELSQMDFLINLKNEGDVQSPSKLIDYMLADRPILDISTAFEMSANVDEFLDGNYSHCHPSVDIQQYNIENVGKAFLNLANPS